MTQVKPIIPHDIDSAWRLATVFAESGMLPRSYYTDDGDSVAKAFTAMQIGAEVGLSPITSILSIATVHGTTTLWGDTQKALVINSGEAEYVREGYDGDDCFKRDVSDKTPNPEFAAWCEVSRDGEVTRVTYSVRDAIDAGLWGKDVWAKHPKRMLRYKARAFCLRDVFPDVLKGLTHSREEMEGELITIDAARKISTPGITPNNPAAQLTGLLNEASINALPTQDEHSMQLAIENTQPIAAIAASVDVSAEKTVGLLQTGKALLALLEAEPDQDARHALFADNNGSQLLGLLRDSGVSFTADKIQALIKPN